MQVKSTVILILVFTAVLSVKLKAQADMTTHFMEAIPQANYENPAMIPDLKFHFSVPGISSIYLEAANSGFHFKNIIENRGDSSYLLLDELVNERLNNNNHFAMHYAHEILSFGINFDERMYFSFAVSEHFNARFTYPKELIALPVRGNAAFLGETVEISPLSFKATHYREYAAGAAWQEPGHWSAGGRFKLLFAKSNLWTEEAYASLYTHPDGYALEAEAEILGHATLPPGMMLEEIDSITGDPDIRDYLMNTANWGVGFDFGFNYIINNDFSVSASIIDLGTVNFNGNTYNYTNEKTKVSFDGFDAYRYVNMTDSTIEDEIRNTIDSITDRFNITKDEEAYTMPLTTRFYVGGRYHISDKQQVGLLFRGQFFDGAFWPAVTASYNHTFGKTLSLAASYTATHDSYFNIGLGASVNAGPVQFYLASDNWMAALIPERTKFLNIRLGLNIVVRQKGEDRPMFDPYH